MKKQLRQVIQRIKSLRIKRHEGHTAPLDSPVSSYSSIPPETNQEKFLYKVRRDGRPFHYNWIIKMCISYSQSSKLVRSYKKKWRNDLIHILKKIAIFLGKPMVIADLESKNYIDVIKDELERIYDLKQDNSSENFDEEKAIKIKMHAYSTQEVANKIERNWESFEDSFWVKINDVIAILDIVIDETCKRNEKEEDQEIQKSLSLLHKSLKRLKVVLSDTIEFKNIALDIKESRSQCPNPEMSDFAKELIKNVRNRAKPKPREYE